MDMILSLMQSARPRSPVYLLCTDAVSVGEL